MQFQNVLTKTSHLQTPKYLMYQDSEIINAAKTGKIPNELYHRLIRGTIHCMNAISSAPPFGRYPSSGELEEMAKSLVLEYPCIKDKETGHVSVNYEIMHLSEKFEMRNTFKGAPNFSLDKMIIDCKSL